MAETRIYGMTHPRAGGPSLPAVYHVSLRRGSYGVRELHIDLSHETIIIWPANRDELRKFAAKLTALVEDDEQWTNG